MNTHRSRWLKRTFLLVASLLAAGLAVSAGAYYLFYSPPPADLPCRGCAGDARSVHVNGFDLYYRSVGERRGRAPVVLLHGGPGMSSSTFKRTFDFLAGSYEVIYYDQRGSGNSQVKPATGEYTIEKLVDELEALRRDIIKADRIIVIGHSAGGALAQRYAVAHGDRVEKMVLIGSVPANGGFERCGPIIETGYAVINVFGGNLPARDPLQADANLAAIQARTSLSRLYDPGRPKLLDGFGYMSFAVNRDITRSTWGGNVDLALAGFRAPSLIIYGVADRSEFTGAPVARRLREILSNSTLVAFEKSGHWPYLEEPERFREVLVDFLLDGESVN